MATHCSPSHQDVYKEARKVAVATILHTDNANHFAMIKDITQVYETYDSWRSAMNLLSQAPWSLVTAECYGRAVCP